MNKDEMIEEMSKIIDKSDEKCGNADCFECEYVNTDRCVYILGATELYNAGYRKVGKDEIVLKKSEYENLRLAQYNAQTTINENFLLALEKIEQAKQDTAREILTTIYSNLKFATFQQTAALRSVKDLANELEIELERN